MAKIIIILVAIAVCSTAHAKIVRPCLRSNNRHSYKCIRDNLAANSNCSPHVKGSLPSQYLVKEFKFEAPCVNASFIESSLKVKNHDKCYVSEFFINTATNTVVLTIDCPYLDLECERELIQHRSKKEDESYYYHIHATYPLVRVTVNMHFHNGLDLCNSRVFAEVLKLPNFHIKPRDKRTDRFLTKDLSLLYIFERENFYYRGYPLIRIFIDSVLCDFGCRPQIY